jgi:anti-sigma factor RsiW
MHPSDLTLNDYVDDLLADSERRRLDDHLRDCPQCRRLIADFGEIRRAATGLGPMDPPPGVWMRVETALRESVSRQSTVDSHQSVDSRQSTVDSHQSPGASASDAREHGASRARRRLPVVGRRWTGARSGGVGVIVSSWQLGGAALVAATLVAAVLVGMRIGQSRRSEPAAAPQLGGAPSAQSIEAELQQAEEHYQKAIAGLEQIANANSSVFDPATAATLAKNLSVVDQAISESRAALRAQPDSEPAQASLLGSFKAKLALLQETVSLINEMRKGDDAAAARIVSGLKRGT